MSDNIAATLKRLSGGLPAGNAKVWLRPAKIYHRVNILADGSLTAVRFFNEARAKYVTNLDQPNQLPANFAMAVSAIRFDWLYGFDRLGYRLGVSGTTPTAAQLEASSLNWGESGATSADELAKLWKIQELSREMLSQGLVTLSIGDRPVFEIFGLSSFPSGKGIVASNALSHAATFTAGSQTSNGMTSINNGVPVWSNRFTFDSPYPIPAGQQFRIDVEYAQKIDWLNATIGPLNGVATTGAPNGVLVAGVLSCELEGTLVCPAN